MEDVCHMSRRSKNAILVSGIYSGYRKKIFKTFNFFDYSFSKTQKRNIKQVKQVKQTISKIDRFIHIFIFRNTVFMSKY